MNEATIVEPACALACEALDVVGNRLAEMDGMHFTIFLLSVINSWAENFIPPEQRIEFFEVIADNVRKLADDERKQAN